MQCLPLRAVLLAMLCLSLTMAAPLLAEQADELCPSCEACPDQDELPSVFHWKALASTPLNAVVRSRSEADGIVTEEVIFHSEIDTANARSVDIFAYFCYPLGARRLPGFIWNQAGLAQADTHFATLAAKRGYASLCIDFPMGGYRSTGGYGIVGSLHLEGDPRDAGIYHGQVALIKAVSFLQSRSEVDPDRIGMAGSSWGGYFALQSAAVDPRVKAAASMFGCGAFQEGNIWWDGPGPGHARFTPEYRQRFCDAFDPAPRLAKVKTPILLVSGTNDHFYWTPALSKTYELAAGPKIMALLPNWSHAVTPELDEQVFAFLDAHLRGKPALLSVSPLSITRQGDKVLATWTFQGERTPRSAHLILSYGGPGNWTSRAWKTLPATIDGRTCAAELPGVGASLDYLVSGTVVDDSGFRASTEIVSVDTAALGLRDPAASLLEIDGAEGFDSFEETQDYFVAAHGMAFTYAGEGYDGQRSVRLRDGAASLAHLRFTAGVPHRFTCHMKIQGEAGNAAGGTRATITVQGLFDGKSFVVGREVRLTHQWQEFSIEFTPPHALHAQLGAEFRTPRNAGALLDQVRLVPLQSLGEEPGKLPDAQGAKAVRAE